MTTLPKINLTERARSFLRSNYGIDKIVSLDSGFEYTLFNIVQIIPSSDFYYKIVYNLFDAVNKLTKPSDTERFSNDS